ncbi:hypothetical protein ACOAOT_20915 [Lacrimispora sp. AGF001]
MGLVGNGVDRFNRTWTSSTEEGGYCQGRIGRTNGRAQTMA